MSDLDLTTLALSWVTTYGAPMVALILLLGAMGVPVPTSLLVIASGAFIRQGFLDLYTTPILGLAGAVVGDTFVYGVGRFARGWITNRFGQMAAWKKAEASFQQRGGIAIYLTRWLLTPIAIPTNLIAGSSAYPLRNFFFFDVTGEITWLLLFGGLGYAFGSQWELISDFITNFSGVILGVLLLGGGLYLLTRYRRQPALKKVQKTGRTP